jgi:hypothetical protein
MGLFDKKSSSKTYVDETTETYSGVDNRIGGDNSIMGGNIVARQVGNITQTDYGAIRQGIGITRDALDFAGNQAANAFTFADTASNNQALVTLGAQDVVRESNKNITGLAENTMKELVGFSTGIGKESLATTKDISNAAIGALGGAVGQISQVVKRANESDSVEIYRVVALGAAALFGLYLIFGKKGK